MSTSVIVNVIALVFPAAMIYAGWRDLVSYEVPNWVSVCLVVGFAAGAAVAGLALTTVAWHLATGAAVLMAGWGLFALRVVGGADAKILAAAAVWTGWSALAEFMLVVGLSVWLSSTVSHSGSGGESSRDVSTSGTAANERCPKEEASVG